MPRNKDQKANPLRGYAAQWTWGGPPVTCRPGLYIVVVRSVAGRQEPYLARMAYKGIDADRSALHIMIKHWDHHPQEWVYTDLVRKQFYRSYGPIADPTEQETQECTSD
jgi:hypothetical protein